MLDSVGRYYTFYYIWLLQFEGMEMGKLSPLLILACICVLFHYSLELVSKSEVRVRMRNFQAFRVFLHNVAPVCCKILRETGRQEEHLLPH